MRVQTQFLLINIIGGIAVLGGYVIALINNPETRNELYFLKLLEEEHL